MDPDGIILVSTFALILTVSESVSPMLTSPLRVVFPVTTKPLQLLHLPIHQVDLYLDYILYRHQCEYFQIQ